MLDISKIVGQNVRMLRGDRDWSGSYLAKIMDTTPQHVSGIEAGSRGLSEKQISKLCEAFGCMPMELFCLPGWVEAVYRVQTVLIFDPIFQPPPCS